MYIAQLKKIVYVFNLHRWISFHARPFPFRDQQQQQQSPSADSTMSERSLVPFALVNLLSSLNNIDVNNFFSSLLYVRVSFALYFSAFFF